MKKILLIYCIILSYKNIFTSQQQPNPYYESESRTPLTSPNTPQTPTSKRIISTPSFQSIIDLSSLNIQRNCIFEILEDLNAKQIITDLHRHILEESGTRLELEKTSLLFLRYLKNELDKITIKTDPVLFGLIQQKAEERFIKVHKNFRS